LLDAVPVGSAPALLDGVPVGSAVGLLDATPLELDSAARVEVAAEVDPLTEGLSAEPDDSSANFAGCGRRGVCGGIGVCAGMGVCPAGEPTDSLTEVAEVAEAGEAGALEELGAVGAAWTSEELGVVGEADGFGVDAFRPEAGLRVAAGDLFADVDFAAGRFGVDPAVDDVAADSAESPEPAEPADPAESPEPAVPADPVEPAEPGEPVAGPSNGSSGDSAAAFFAPLGVDFVVLRRGVFFGGWSAGPEAAGVGGWFSSLTGCSFGLAWGRADGSTSG
jgi:hypothetical protein